MALWKRLGKHGELRAAGYMAATESPNGQNHEAAGPVTYGLVGLEDRQVRSPDDLWPMGNHHGVRNIANEKHPQSYAQFVIEHQAHAIKS
jgi:hypothetical protein